jgi:uncharacterized protein YqeY
VKQKLQDDLKAAMKAGDKVRTMVLRGLLAEVSRYEVEKEARREADEAAIVQIIKRERSRREEALEFAKKAARSDLIEQNRKEAEILEAYLPPQLSPEEVAAAISEQVSAGVTQMGPIMKALRERFGPRLDGKLASELVRQALAGKA